MVQDTNPIRFDDFVNPNSMITPGAAGAFTMVITNTLCSQFAGLPGNWTALLVSFLFGALTFLYAAKLAIQLIYFVINSLIIFVMAHGSNAIGAAATRTAIAEAYAPAQIVRFIDEPSPLHPMVILASETSASPSVPQRAQIPHIPEFAQNSDDSDKKKRGFFKSWSWTQP